MEHANMQAFAQSANTVDTAISDHEHHRTPELNNQTSGKNGFYKSVDIMVASTQKTSSRSSSKSAIQKAKLVTTNSEPMLNRKITNLPSNKEQPSLSVASSDFKTDKDNAEYNKTQDGDDEYDDNDTILKASGNVVNIDHVKRQSSMVGAMRWHKILLQSVDNIMNSFPIFKKHQCINVDDAIYIFGEVEGEDLAKLLVIDTSSFCWKYGKHYGDIPRVHEGYSFTYVGNQQAVLFGGGDGRECSESAFILNLDTFVWSKLRPLPGTKWPQARKYHTAVYVKSSSKLFIFAGTNGNALFNDVWFMELKDGKSCSWDELKNDIANMVIPDPRIYSSAATVDDKLLIFGGFDGNRQFGDLYMFDIHSNTWTLCFDNPTKSRYGHSILVAGNYIFCFGGYEGDYVTNSILILNMLTWSIEEKPMATFNLPDPRAYHSSMLHDSRIFLISGSDEPNRKFFDDMWILELANQAFLPRITGFRLKGSDAINDPNSGRQEKEEHESNNRNIPNSESNRKISIQRS